MVYVAPDGTIYQSRPWGLRMVTDFFWRIINFVVAFCQTLIPGGTRSNATSSSRGSRPGGPGGGPGGPRRRIGGISTLQDCSMPGGG